MTPDQRRPRFPATPAEPGRLEIAPGLWFDARRAAWLPASRSLIIADLHLGYAWVQRRRGALLPIETPDGALDRLDSLAADYRPARWILLGDIVHAAAPLPGVEQALGDVVRRLGAGVERIGCLGNHDRRLGELVQRLGLDLRLATAVSDAGFDLRHGDDAPSGAAENAPLRLTNGNPTTVIGHEHPCVSLADGPAGGVRAPCALLSGDTIVLPAFSDWAAGCVVGARPFLGARARAARFTHAVACLGPRLLKLPLNRL